LKNNKQKRSELKARKAAKREGKRSSPPSLPGKRGWNLSAPPAPAASSPVDTTRLSPAGYSYSIPAFVERGT
jgi:hypothetical protein